MMISQSHSLSLKINIDVINTSVIRMETFQKVLMSAIYVAKTITVVASITSFCCSDFKAMPCLYFMTTLQLSVEFSHTHSHHRPVFQLVYKDINNFIRSLKIHKLKETLISYYSQITCGLLNMVIRLAGLWRIQTKLPVNKQHCRISQQGQQSVFWPKRGADH